MNNGLTDIATNTTVNKTPSFVDISVTKKWSGKELDSVNAELYADGTKIDSQKLSNDNNWKYTFRDLSKYKDGKEITYTVDEEYTEGYTKSISGNAKDGFTIVNTEIDIPKETPKATDPKVTEAESKQPEKGKTPKEKVQEVPKTGDSDRTGVYVWVVLSAAGIGAALVLRKKKRS